MHTMVLFLDSHTDPMPAQVLTGLLESLRKEGYEKLYLESPPFQKLSGPTIDKLIKKTDAYRKHLTMFSNGIVPPKSGRTKPQNKWLNENGNEIERINGELKFYQGRAKGLEARSFFLKEVKRVGMEVICIDEEAPTRYSLEERNTNMFKRMRADLSKRESSKSILFAGLAHILNVWEAGKYHHGLHHLLSSQIQNVCTRVYFTYSVDDSVTKEALRHLAECDEKIVRKVKLAKLEEKQLAQMKTLEALEKESVYLKEEKGSSEVYAYGIPFEEKENTLSYIKDLNGLIIRQDKMGKLPLIVVNFPSYILTEKRRELLGIDRLEIPQLCRANYTLLKYIVPCLTEEECVLENNSPGLRLTFPRLDTKAKKNVSRERIEVIVSKELAHGRKWVPAVVTIGFFRAVNADESGVKAIPIKEAKKTLMASLAKINEFNSPS